MADAHSDRPIFSACQCPDPVKCPKCSDPLALEMWGRLPLATTLHLRERFRAYRERPGVTDGSA